MPAFLLVASLALGIVQEPPSPATLCPAHLFTIERSKNANVVVYDARLGDSGELDPKNPVVVYWLLKAQDGRREELNRVERQRAYGFDVDPGEDPGTFAFRLKAGKKRPFIVAMRDGCPVALGTIGGRPAILERIFVKEKPGMTLKVESVDIFGRDGADGRPVTETIIPQQ
jgi:hypothetical protein